MTDIIGDTLARLHNSVLVGKPVVSVRKTNLVKGVLDVLVKEKMIMGFKESDDGKNFDVSIRYVDDVPYVTHFIRVSRPGQRIYIKSDKIVPIMNGRGIGIISTSRGVVSAAVAKAENIGGEYLCKIW